MELNLTAAYELWRVVMYGVGVFVTCNAAGLTLYAALRRARRNRRRADGRQSWADLRRQIDCPSAKVGGRAGERS